MKKETYIKMTQPFRENPELAKGIHIANKLCTGVMYCAYPILLAYLFFFEKNSNLYDFWKALFVPGVSFVLLSIGRDWINRPRPYEAFETPPVIPKDTKGHSFPSRHVFSATLIAVTFLFMSPWSWLGWLFLGVSLALAVIRVVSGVHYISDVIAGIVIAVIAGLIGYRNMIFLLGIILLLLITAFIVLNILARQAVRPTVHTLEYERERIEKYTFLQDESFEIINEHEVETFDGQNLWVGFVPGNPECRDYVILSHGYTSTRYGMYKYVALWRRLGYNCVLYDNRGHGANKPTATSFGVFESKDLMTIIEDTYACYGKDIRLGLHGESMGAGLQLMALSHEPKVDFIVNDCGYAEISSVLRQKVKKNFHLPACLLDFASPICRICYGFRFEEVRPIDRLKDNEIPICFVHGTNDTLVPPEHTTCMYEVNKGYKELHLYENAEHARSMIEDPKRYEKMLREFVENVYGQN